MKFNFFSLIIICIIITGCNPDPCGHLYLRKPNPYEDLQLTYLKQGAWDIDQPYTGRCGNYSEEGKLLSIHQYQDGFDHGKWVFYYENGKVETQGKFEMGKRDGKWEYYHENGALQQISYYDMGIRDKEWIRFSEEGDTLWTEKYVKKSDE